MEDGRRRAEDGGRRTDDGGRGNVAREREEPGAVYASRSVEIFPTAMGDHLLFREGIRS